MQISSIKRNAAKMIAQLNKRNKFCIR